MAWHIIHKIMYINKFKEVLMEIGVMINITPISIKIYHFYMQKEFIHFNMAFLEKITFPYSFKTPSIPEV